jgi:hypothetical protein
MREQAKHAKHRAAGLFGQTTLPDQRKTDFQGSVSRSSPLATSRVFDGAIDLLCPSRTAVANAIGLKRDTLNQYIGGRYATPRSVMATLADAIRKHSANLAYAASALDDVIAISTNFEQ